MPPRCRHDAATMPPRWRRRKLAAEFEFAQWAEVAWRWVSQREVAGPRDGDARYATERDIDAALVDIVATVERLRGAADPLSTVIFTPKPDQPDSATAICH